MDKFKSLDDPLSEKPSYGKKGGITKKCADKGSEHDHQKTQVAQPGEYAAKEDRCFSFQEGPDDDTDVSVFRYVGFHISSCPHSLYYRFSNKCKKG